MDLPTAKPIYLDYAATTPVDPRVVQAMLPYLGELFGNPASRSHAFGWAVEEAVEIAREHVAALVGADPREIVWTSGATESNNLAIKGAAQFHKARGRHLVTVKTEHKAVLDTMRELERHGVEPIPVSVDHLSACRSSKRRPHRGYRLAFNQYVADKVVRRGHNPAILNQQAHREFPKPTPNYPSPILNKKTGEVSLAGLYVIADELSIWH